MSTFANGPFVVVARQGDLAMVVSPPGGYDYQDAADRWVEQCSKLYPDVQFEFAQWASF